VKSIAKYVLRSELSLSLPCSLIGSIHILKNRVNNYTSKMEGKINGSQIYFFDIDGTLKDYEGCVSESTIKALEFLKARGHRMFVCTGRPYCQVDEYLKNLGLPDILQVQVSIFSLVEHVFTIIRCRFSY